MSLKNEKQMLRMLLERKDLLKTLLKNERDYFKKCDFNMQIKKIDHKIRMENLCIEKLLEANA